MNFTHQETKFDVLLDVRNRLPEFLSGHRLYHTLCVETEAVNIAKKLFAYLNIDEKYLYDVSASALLHDITKQFSQEKQEGLCQKYGLEYKNDGVLHSHTSAYFSRDEFGINDIVFGAVYHHTTGCENMNIFEKIVFISDYIEISRTAQSCIEARNYFWNNIDKKQNKIKVLDQTILLSLNSTLDFLKEKGAEIDKDTVKARDFLLAEYALHS